MLDLASSELPNATIASPRPPSQWPRAITQAYAGVAHPHATPAALAAAANASAAAAMLARPATSTGPAEGTLSPAEGILGAVGQTPTVALRRLLRRTDLEAFAKLEFCNPAGSMKDRPSAAMLQAAIADGTLRPGMTVVESSSGNMGIGLAQACAYHGFPFVCVVDPRTQQTNIEVMRAYGATIDLVAEPDPATGDFLAARLNRVRHLTASRDDVFWPNQYANPNNPQAHTEGTAAELHAAAGPLDLLLVATSTTGTLGGCLAYFRRESPGTRIAAVDAAGSVLFGGTNGPRRISGLGAGRTPSLAEGLRPDRVERVTDLDCVVGCRRLVRDEAILAGGSAGGLVTTLLRLEPELPSGCRVGMIIADHGSRYLQTVYSDDWVRETTGLDRDALQHRVESLKRTTSDRPAASRETPYETTPDPTTEPCAATLGGATR